MSREKKMSGGCFDGDVSMDNKKTQIKFHFFYSNIFSFSCKLGSNVQQVRVGDCRSGSLSTQGTFTVVETIYLHEVP